MSRPRAPWFGIVERNLDKTVSKTLELVKQQFPEADITKGDISAKKYYIRKLYGLKKEPKYDDLIEENIYKPTMNILRIIREEHPDDNPSYSQIYRRHNQLKEKLNIKPKRERRIERTEDSIPTGKPMDKKDRLYRKRLPKSSQLQTEESVEGYKPNFCFDTKITPIKYDGKSLVTPNHLARAIQLSCLNKNKEMDDSSAIELTYNVFTFFGFDDRIVDNVLTPADRDVFYMLEDVGLVRSEMEETTLYNEKKWRTHYWVLGKERINEILNNGKAKRGEEQDVYKSLPENVWEREY